MSALANSLTDNEKSAISKECERFLRNDEKLGQKFLSCTEEEQEWVLNYLCTGKGTIPYEMITRYNSLDVKPENGEFFLPHQFFSTLKDNILSDEEYKNVKKFYQTMKLENLGELNKIYNFQDTIILCEIFEQRSSHLQNLFKFNPRKCNSASSFSGCVHRDKSKCCIALPTDAEHVRIFEKTLIGGFSCVNTRLAFDTEILRNYEKKNNKVLFELHIDGKKQTKRIPSKILKMDENNQYWQAMTKPLSYGCIKKQEHVPSITEFNKILDKMSHEDNIGHLFIVDIKFHDVNPKTLLFNEIYPPVFEKNKKMEPYERSTLQIMSLMVRDKNKDKINSFPYTSKTHSTLKEQKFIPLYAEDLHFLVTHAGWLVTHIYEHYTFEQSKFKKDFAVMNQKSRLKATSSVEKDFFELHNKSNFGIDCRDNIDNYILEPIYDDFTEISYIKVRHNFQQ